METNRGEIDDGNPNAHSRFFALCGTGILLSLVAPASRQGNVLAWLGCLAAVVLVLAGANALLAGEHFQSTAVVVAGIGTTLTLNLDRLSAVFLSVTGLVLFPASIFAGGELNRESGHVTMDAHSRC